jgi:hypothetical protein
MIAKHDDQRLVQWIYKGDVTPFAEMSLGKKQTIKLFVHPILIFELIK